MIHALDGSTDISSLVKAQAGAAVPAQIQHSAKLTLAVADHEHTFPAEFDAQEGAGGGNLRGMSRADPNTLEDVGAFLLEDLLAGVTRTRPR